MRLLALTMAKNERDVIELFVRHTLQFVDVMAIIDNVSTDGTSEILSELVHESLPMVVFRDPRPGYHQSERITTLYRNATRFFDVDFALSLDADEFIGAPSLPALESALEASS